MSILEVSSIIEEQIKHYGIDIDKKEMGNVISTGDGIARIFGLLDCMSGELLEFENGSFGIAINLEEDNIGCVILGDFVGIEEGTKVFRTKKTVSVPVGDALIGRVVNPLGQPIDGKGSIDTNKFRPIEAEAPSVNDRKGVDTPLQTGIMAIDAIVPIGRGQRELIIGDRQTGKTSIAIDAILNQKDTGVICIYVAIGQKNSSVAAIKSILERFGAMSYTIIVSSSAGDSSSMQYIAPYAGCAMAEEFMYTQKKDVLIIYDDLSKHAVAYRTLSLLLRRPPGREAYPGDVFYLHSRLLERAARLSDKLGGASITALPIIETQGGDFSAYIPTNVISITDGQIYLQSDLFFAGLRPAINVGISVSRVGGSAQTKAMKKVVGSLRMNLAQFRELEVFAQFGSELDKVTREKLIQGERLIETLKQQLYKPKSVEEQVIILFLATGTGLMDVAINKVLEFNNGFFEYVKARYPQTPINIKQTGQLSNEDTDILKNAIQEFKKTFV